MGRRVKTNFQSLNMGWGQASGDRRVGGVALSSGPEDPARCKCRERRWRDPGGPPNPSSGHLGLGINRLVCQWWPGWGCAEVRGHRRDGSREAEGTPPSLVSALRKEGGEPGTILTSTHSGQKAFKVCLRPLKPTSKEPGACPGGPHHPHLSQEQAGRPPGWDPTRTGARGAGAGAATS